MRKTFAVAGKSAFDELNSSQKPLSNRHQAQSREHGGLSDRHLSQIAFCRHKSKASIAKIGLISKPFVHVVSPPSASQATSCQVSHNPNFVSKYLSAFDRTFVQQEARMLEGDLRNPVRVWRNDTCSDCRGLRGFEAPSRSCLQMLSLSDCAVLKLHPLSPAIGWKLSNAGAFVSSSIVSTELEVCLCTLRR